MTRSVSYILIISSMLLVVAVMASKFFGLHIPAIGSFIARKPLEISLLAYWMLFVARSRTNG